MNLPKIGKFLFPAKHPKDGKKKQKASLSPENLLKSELPEKTYHGMKMDWDLIVRNMHSEIDPNEIQVLTSFGDIPANIWINVNISQFPEILQCFSGRRIRVKGEVGKIHGQDIYLNNCQVEID